MKGERERERERESTLFATFKLWSHCLTGLSVVVFHDYDHDNDVITSSCLLSILTPNELTVFWIRNLRHKIKERSACLKYLSVICFIYSRMTSIHILHSLTDEAATPKLNMNSLSQRVLKDKCS